jgi:hypothetical protein
MLLLCAALLRTCVPLQSTAEVLSWLRYACDQCLQGCLMLAGFNLAANAALIVMPLGADCTACKLP